LRGDRREDPCGSVALRSGIGRRAGRLGPRGSHADGDAHGNPDGDSDRHAHGDSDRHAHGDSDRHAHGDPDGHADCDPDGHADCNTHRDADGDSDRHTDGDADRHAGRESDGHADRDAHGDSDGHADCDTHRDADGDSDRHAGRESDGHADRDTHRDADGDSDRHAGRESDGHADRDADGERDPAADGQGHHLPQAQEDEGGRRQRAQGPSPPRRLAGRLQRQQEAQGLIALSIEPDGTAQRRIGAGRFAFRARYASGIRQEWIDSSPGISRARVRMASSASRSAKSCVCMRSTGTLRRSSSRMALA
jgi:hypothetical protein